jgi:hypothetical protein
MAKRFTKEEASELIKKWMNHIKNLVLQTEFGDDEVYVEYLASSKDSDKGYKVQLVAGRLGYTRGREKERITVLMLELRFMYGKQDAWLLSFGDQDPFPKFDEHYSSWEEGVQKYFEIGTEWLSKMAPVLEIPSVPA